MFRHLHPQAFVSLIVVVVRGGHRRQGRARWFRSRTICRYSCLCCNLSWGKTVNIFPEESFGTKLSISFLRMCWGIGDLTCAKWPSSSRFSCSKVSTWRKIRCVRNLLLKEAKLWLPTLEGGRPWTHNFNTRSPHKSSFYWNFPGYRLWMRSV